MIKISLIILTIFLVSYTQKSENIDKPLNITESQIQTTDTLTKKDLSWADQYVNWYLNQESDNLKTNDSLTLSFIKNYQINLGQELVQVKIGYKLQSHFEIIKRLYIDYKTHSMAEYDIKDSNLIKWPNQDKYKSEIPKSGEYLYDMAFAEWQGESMGKKVTVIIENDSIKIIYKTKQDIALSNKGVIIDSGLLRKHISGFWIIAKSEMDIYATEFGGCSSGPKLIDFQNKKYWNC